MIVTVKSVQMVAPLITNNHIGHTRTTHIFKPVKHIPICGATRCGPGRKVNRHPFGTVIIVIKGIHPGSTRQDVAVIATAKAIIPIAANQNVIAVPPGQGVIAISAKDDVVTGRIAKIITI